MSSSSFKVAGPLSDFLNLAPIVSESYPTKAQVESATSSTAPSTAAPSSPELASAGGAAFGPRRESTASTTSNSSQALRFLKLAPVHYGQHYGQENVDFNEVAVEE